MDKKVMEGIPQGVKATITQVDEDAKVILFGSRARGDFKSTSDWDFLILTKKRATRQFQDRIRELLYDLELTNNEVITSIIENERAWQNYKESEFYKNVQKDGIEIILPKAA